MRKLIVFGALLAFAAALIGCGKKSDEASGGNNDSASGNPYEKMVQDFCAAAQKFSSALGMCGNELLGQLNMREGASVLQGSTGGDMSSDARAFFAALSKTKDPVKTKVIKTFDLKDLDAQGAFIAATCGDVTIYFGVGREGKHGEKEVRIAAIIDKGEMERKIRQIEIKEKREREGGLFSDVSSGFSNGGKMQAVIDDYVREVVEEAKGVRVIYTDGVFDDDIRREAKRRGIELEPVSIMSRNGALALAMAVERGEDVALQLGFELWKQRLRQELPPCSGVLVRTGKMPEEDRQRGVDAARCLGERILELYRKDAVSFGWDKDLKKRFLAVQWHIARLATVRAERADHACQVALAQKNTIFADELDSNNAELKRFRLEWNEAVARLMRVITPRRGLRMSLEQEDFTQAKRYAELILAGNPDNTDANFAMGMSYHVQKQWSRAEVYFRRYLAKKEDAAVLNNLAIDCMEMGRYDEALALANRAVELLPKSGEVKKTVAEIEERKAEAAKKGDEKQNTSGNTSSAGAPASSQPATKAAPPVVPPSPVADAPAAPAKKEPDAKTVAKNAPGAKQAGKKNADGKSAAKTKSKGKTPPVAAAPEQDELEVLVPAAPSASENM